MPEEHQGGIRNGILARFEELTRRLNEHERKLDLVFDPEHGVIAKVASMDRNVASMTRWVRWGIPLILSTILAVEGIRLEEQRLLAQTVQRSVQQSVPSAVQKGIDKCLEHIPQCTPSP